MPMPTKVLLPNGMRVSEDSPGIAKIIHSQVVDYFEHPDGGVPPARFRDGMVVFDVGMNIGLFSLECLHRAAERKFACTVFGFEPIPSTYAIAKANLADNGYLDEGNPRQQRAVPLNRGCSEAAGLVTFTHLPGWSARSSCMPGGMTDLDDHHWTNIEFMMKAVNAGQMELPDCYLDIIPWYIKWLPERLARAVHWAVAGSGNTRVSTQELVDAELVTLSSIIRDHKVSRIDLLKVDVEKAELLVLKGLTDADWRLVQAAVVEVHDEDGKLDAIKALFVKAGLTKVDVVQEAAFEGTTVYTLIACRGDGSGRGRAGSRASRSPARR